MQFILENYLLIVLIGLFFVFALIGYLIDMLRKVNDDNSKEEKSDVINSVNIAKLDDVKESTEEKKVDSDELLKNYEEDLTNKNV